MVLSLARASLSSTSGTGKGAVCLRQYSVYRKISLGTAKPLSGGDGPPAPSLAASTFEGQLGSCPKIVISSIILHPGKSLVPEALQRGNIGLTPFS